MGTLSPFWPVLRHLAGNTTFAVYAHLQNHQASRMLDVTLDLLPLTLVIPSWDAIAGLLGTQLHYALFHITAGEPHVLRSMCYHEDQRSFPKLPASPSSMGGAGVYQARCTEGRLFWRPPAGCTGRSLLLLCTRPSNVQAAPIESLRPLVHHGKHALTHLGNVCLRLPS